MDPEALAWHKSKQVCPSCCARLQRQPVESSTYAQLYAAAPGGRDESEAALCPLCLGILQGARNKHAEGGSAGNGSAVGTEWALPLLSTESKSGKWQHAAACTVPVLADVLRGSGHTLNALSTSLQVPGILALQAALVMSLLMRDFPAKDCRELYQNATPIKHVLRSLLCTPLLRELQCEAASDQLVLSVTFVHEAEAQATAFLRPTGMKRKRGETVAKGYSWGGHAAVWEAASRMSPDELLRKAELQHSPVFCFAKVHREPVYVGGRYLKLKRMVSQTPWFTSDTPSVSAELEVVLLKAFEAEGMNMIASGREDIDVRMLGDGRPFILEVFNARIPAPDPKVLDACASALQQRESGVRVLNLQMTTSSLCQKVKEGEEDKRKVYRAVCWASRALTSADKERLESKQDITIQQDTPVRVLHRRAPMVRPKIIHQVKCEIMQGRPEWFVLNIQAQAGAYIKEFCHGDFGRTQPSVADLLEGDCEVQIVELDVVDVQLDVFQSPQQ